MRGIWASPPIGGCVSAAPERSGSEYVFANRCDYLGPARTTISVTDENAYVEIDELKGTVARIDTVSARRVGDCPAGKPPAPRPR